MFAGGQVPRSQGIIPASYFGLNFNFIPTTPWPQIGYGTARLWNQSNTWLDVETAKGVYVWSVLDAQVAQAPTDKALIYTFGKVPGWANGGDGSSNTYMNPPTTISDFTDFVTAIVTRYQNRIRYWELGNETGAKSLWPYLNADLIPLCAVAYGAIKAIDPTLKVLTPCFSGTLGPANLSTFLSGGGGAYSDITSVHGYHNNNIAETVVARTMQFDAVRMIYAENAKELWFTEQGYGANTNLPDINDETSFLARSAILHWWRGVRVFGWYAYDSTWGTLYDVNLAALTQNGVAYGELYKWMVGAHLEGISNRGTVWQANFTRPGYSACAVWDTSGNSSFAVPVACTQYHDLAGGLTTGVSGSVTIGIKPILLETGRAF